MVNFFETSLETPASTGTTAYRLALARALQQPGKLANPTGTDRVYSTGEGMARLAAATIGGVMEAFEERKASKERQALAAALVRFAAGDAASGVPGAAPSLSPSAPSPSVPSIGGTGKVSAADPEIEKRFIETIKSGGLTNPNALAAVAAYGNAESRYSPANVNRTWSDPSESGQAGTSGGLLSWRADRLRRMQDFVAQQGGDPVEAQAKFFLAEDPSLIERLNAAKTPEEAHGLMANAWKFAGYNRPGGENQRRLDLTKSYLPRFASTQVASADPNFVPAPTTNPADLPIENAGPAVAGGDGKGFFAIPNPGQEPTVVPADLPVENAKPAGLSIAPAEAAPAPSMPATAPLPPERPPETYTPRAPQVPPQAMAAALQAPALDPNSNDAGAKQFAASGMGADPRALAAAMMGRPAPQAAPQGAPPPAPAPLSAEVRQGDMMHGFSAAAPGQAARAAAPTWSRPPSDIPLQPPSAPPVDERRAAAMRVLSSEYATPAMQSAVLAMLNQKPTHVDLGDAVGLIDARGNLMSRVPKSKFAEYGVIGKDLYGNEQYGWKNPNTQEVRPGPVPGTAQQPALGPDGNPLPPDVDPKLVRDARSKSYAEGALPADPKTVAGLRKEVQDLPSYKNVAQAAPVYKSMHDAAGRDTRAADVNLIYGLAKVMDPSSVVRESEMTIAQAIATLPQQLRQTIESQLTATGRLSSEVRAQIMQEAHSRLSAYQAMFDQDAAMYRGIAQRGRINEADVLPQFGPFRPFEPQKPAAGGAGPMQPGEVRQPRPGVTIQRLQ